MLSGVSLAKLLTFIDLSKLNILGENSNKNFGLVGFLLIYTTLVLPWNFLPFKVEWLGIITLASVLFTIFIEKYDLKRAVDPSYKSTKFFGFLNYLGGLSFAIFLIHMLFLTRINELYRAFLFQKLGAISGGFAILFLTLILVIPVSIFLFHAVEKPAAKWIENKFIK